MEKGIIFRTKIFLVLLVLKLRWMWII